MEVLQILPTVIKVLLATLVVLGVSHTLYKHRKEWKFPLLVIRRFRPLMLLEVLGALTAVVATLTLLWLISPLRWGWLNLVYEGGGNIVAAPLHDATDSSSLLLKVLVLMFFLFLAVGLSFMAKYEEDTYRRGHEDWGSIVKQSIKFGLIHLFMGIPIAAGLALILAGLFFGYKYKRTFDKNYRRDLDAQGFQVFDIEAARNEAVMVSTTYHTMWNMVLVTAIVVTILASM